MTRFASTAGIAFVPIELKCLLEIPMLGLDMALLACPSQAVNSGPFVL